MPKKPIITRKRAAPNAKPHSKASIRRFAQTQANKIKEMPDKRLWKEVGKARVGKAICEQNGIQMNARDAIIFELLEKEFAKRNS